MEDLGLQVTGGDHGTVGRFREQMRRLLSQPFFEAIRKRPVPADKRILRGIKQSTGWPASKRC